MSKTLIKIERLTKQFSLKNRLITAIDNLNLTIEKGETLGLVGESGCGKSTIGKTILRLHEPTSGSIHFDGVDILSLSTKQMRDIRRRMQIIFQDPYASLNPRMTVQEIIGEPLDIHKLARGLKRRERIEELLKLVGLNSDHMSRYPHEFSGGQRQRIGIARALAVEPDFIVCDEPLSALDVSIQAQVVNLLKDLQKRLGLTYLFIAHDLSMVEYFTDRVAVVYLGNLVELAPNEELYKNSLHPYTQALFSSIPVPDPQKARAISQISANNEISNKSVVTQGCIFQNRCPHVMPVCRVKNPPMLQIGQSHSIACHLHQ